ncbi:MAG: hypothetical protein J1E35_05895 [Lachnospiraceae bacterium]|nr:hypothetical protein [Lachnospiraceae bacterium]
MRKIGFKKVICLLLTALAMVLSGTVSANAASDIGRTYINSTYGYLEGSVRESYDSFCGEKIYNAAAETEVAVSRIRAYMKVMYAKSGDTIDTSTSGWEYNSKRTSTFDFEMHHFRNKETGIYDGFVNTQCVAYGTADAITDKAYAVYTCVVY